MMKCKVCDEEIKNDGELVVKSNAGGSVNFVHTDCHYQHLLNYCTEEFLEFCEFDERINQQNSDQ